MRPPELLAPLPQWLGYRSEWLEERGKYTKKPVSPHDGGPGSSTNSATWGSFEQATAAVQRLRLDGLGFALSKQDPFTAIDLDGCRNPETGEIAEWAEKVVNRFRSYTEVSPSGTGLHIILAGALPVAGRRKGPIEVYHSGRYITVTGDALPGFEEILERGDELAGWFAETFPVTGPQDAARWEAALSLADEDVLQRIGSARNGPTFLQLYAGDMGAYGGDHSAADLALVSMLAFWTQDPDQLDRLFRSSGLMREKWEKRADYRRRTLERALSGLTETYNPIHNSHTPKPQLAVCPPEVTNEGEDPLERLAYLEAALAEERAQRIRLEAEVQRLRTENQRMKERHDWEVQLDKVPNKHLKASEKQVARDLLRQSYYWRDKGLEGPQPVLISTVRNEYGVALGRTEFTGLSPDTYSKGLQALHETGTIVRDVVTDPNSGHKRVMVSLTDKFFREPAAIRKSQESNHGGKRCPECGSTRIKAIRWACEDCGVAFDRPAEAVAESPPEAEANMQEWEDLYQRAEKSSRVVAPPKPQDAGYRGVEVIPYAAADGVGVVKCTFTPYGRECPHPTRCSEQGGCSP